MSKIYFIQQGDDGPVKIGSTYDINGRLEKAKTFSPYPVRVLAIINGDRRREKVLHRKFKLEKLRGEWFKPSERLMGFIQTLPNNNLSQPIEVDGVKLLSPIELSEILRFKPERILGWVRRGKVPYVSIKGGIYFKPSEIERWINEFENVTKSPTSGNLKKGGIYKCWKSLDCPCSSGG